MSKPIEVPFPRFIDRPRMVGIFEIDEAALTLFTMVSSVLYGFFTQQSTVIVMPTGLIVGVFLAMALHKFKANNPNGYTMHLLYKKGIYHPVIDNKKILRKDIKKHNLKIIPTGIVKVFFN